MGSSYPPGRGEAGPIWSCSGWGLPCRWCYHQRGALLPHLFTLTDWSPAGGLFSVALSVDSRPPGVTWHPARWSPDFPPLPDRKGDCLANSRNNINKTQYPEPLLQPGMRSKTASGERPDRAPSQADTARIYGHRSSGRSGQRPEPEGGFRLGCAGYARPRRRRPSAQREDSLR